MAEKSSPREAENREESSWAPEPNGNRRVPTLLGLDLPVRETHYPREGYEAESEAPPVSSLHEELPREVIEYDKNIPLIAEPGMDRRRPLAWEKSGSEQDILREPLDEVRPADVRSLEEEPVTHSTTRGSSVLSTNSIFGLDTPSAIEERELLHETPREKVKDHRVERTSGFLDFSEPTTATSGGGSLHGPSFLGLSSSPEDYDDDYEETVSHGRRNFALLVLVILAVLIGLQWRSIRDFGVRYAQNGGIHIPGMKTGSKDANKQDANATAANANNSTAVTGQTPASNGEGPNIEVAPAQNPNVATGSTEQSANANNAQGNAGQVGGTNQANEPQSSSPQNTGGAAGASQAAGADQAAQKSNPDNSGAAKDKGAGGTAVAANTNTADKDTTASEDVAEPEPPSGDTEKPASRTKKQQPSRKPVDDTTQFGAAELAQANASSDPATIAGLLWKSTSKGNPIAPVQLADMYLAGRGVPQDCEQALVLLRSAAAKKNPRARTKLGSLYATGQCVEQDRVQAYHWMTLALAVNPGSEWVERNRESLWEQMTASERQRASRDRR